MPCRTHANTSHRHIGRTMGSEVGRATPQAHAADIYNAIAASAKAVQSTTGCKNSLSREQESQQEKWCKNEREERMTGCRRRRRHRKRRVGWKLGTKGRT